MISFFLQRSVRNSIFYKNLSECISLAPKPWIQKGRVWSHRPYTLVSSGEMGTERFPALNLSPLLQCRPSEAMPGKEVRCLWGQFGMRASLHASPSGISPGVKRLGSRNLPVFKYYHPLEGDRKVSCLKAFPLPPMQAR